jgi:EmrB/QacA subfamily drug resistance transporter
VLQLSHRQILVVYTGLMLGMLLAALDQTIVSTALPTIVGQLGGLSRYAWVGTAYILAQTISTPMYGKLGDLYGRKRILRIAIVIFLLGSVLCGIAQNLDELIGFRAIQGLGAGGLMVSAFAIIGDVVPPRERGRYQGYMGGVFALASVVGPLVGGFLVDNLSWRWVFYVNVPVGIVALVVVGAVLPELAGRKAHRLDLEGAALLIVWAGLLTLGLTWGGTTYPWGSGKIISILVVGVVALAFFFLQERRAVEPIIPPHLFRNSTFTCAAIIGFLVACAMFGAIFYLPVFLQVVQGASATSSGLRLLPLMGGLLVASIGSGRVISKIGRYRAFPVAGTALIAVGMWLLSRISATTSYASVSVGMVVLGVGLGLVMPVLVLAVQNAVDHRDMGAATAATTFFRSIGGSFGIAIFGAIFINRLTYWLRKDMPASAHLDSTHLANLLHGTPAQMKALPPAVHTGLIDAIASSLHTVFLWAIPLGIVAFLISLRVREVPLRDVGAASIVAATAEGSGEAAA